MTLWRSMSNSLSKSHPDSADSNFGGVKGTPPKSMLQRITKVLWLAWGVYDWICSSPRLTRPEV